MVEGNQPHRRRLPTVNDIRWEHIKHSDHGGATSGQFWFGYPKTQNISPRGLYSSRVLINIIAPASKAFQTECHPPDGLRKSNQVEYIERNVSSMGLMPIDLPHAQIICPSVFTPLKWCLRRLTIKELGECFDQTYEVIEEAILLKLHRQHLPFLKGIPNKIVQFAMRRIGLITVNQVLQSLKPSPLPIIYASPLEDSNNLKAAKADDAQIENKIWDDRVLQNFPHLNFNNDVAEKFNLIRSMLVKMWAKRLWKSFFRYLCITYTPQWCASPQHKDLSSELNKDIKRFVQCSWHARRASWFDWDSGSTLFLWRWQPEFRAHARDGLPMWNYSQRPKFRKPQSPEQDDMVRDRLISKIGNVRNRGYIQPGYVKSMIRYFTVPKGENDVRVVYDGTSCGFNDTVWAPSFSLYTVNSLLRIVEPGTWMGDMDLGEMFLNFPLHPDAQVYCGVDLTHLFPEALSHPNEKLWERWTRYLMGAKSSPYQAIRAMLWAEDIIRGDRWDSQNPFMWSHVRLNLPGSSSYDPRLPWVSKLQEDDSIATDFLTYVDDIRVGGKGEDRVWQGIRRISARATYLGIQDANRKVRSPATRTGAWEGSIVYVDGGYVGTHVDQLKWDKSKSHLDWIHEQQSRSDNTTNSNPYQEPKGIDRKGLESRRDFLVYVSRTYPAMVPYLKGIHHTLDAWRDGRDADGWRLTAAELGAAKHSLYLGLDTIETNMAPETVFPVPRLEGGLSALK